MSDLAPIVLFVYNRPWHTEQTLKALEKNLLAENSILYIYSDGAKENASKNDLQNIEEVKKIITQNWRFKEINIVKRGTNLGLADNIVDGVTNIVNKYGKIIVLEDDIVTSSGFLKYMNDALELYQDDEKVMHISGYMFPIKSKLPETFFYNTASCWGWATWKRAWANYDGDAYYLLQTLYEKKLESEFNIHNTYLFTNQLIDNITQIKKTWAVKWYASFYILGGCALHPGKSLTNNIGLDNSGDNCSNDMANSHSNTTLCEKVNVKKLNKYDDRKIRLLMSHFYSPKKLFSLNSTLKLLLPPIVINIYRRIKYGKELTSENQRISNLSRFKSSQTNILGGVIYFPDAGSFKFMYEEIFINQIYKFKSTQDVPKIIDVGANIGLSILYFKKIFPKASIIGFEPDPNIYGFLKKNVLGFNYSDVLLINKAVWKEKTTLAFKADGADGGKIDNSIGQILVESDLLSEYLEETVDFLKIDVEGAEIEILEEIEHKLNNVKSLFIEFHSFVSKKQSLSKIIKILEARNFRYHINSPGLNSTSPLFKLNKYMSMDMQLNIFAWQEI